MLSLLALVALSAEPEPINRLDLARVWEAAQLFHPSVMHRESGLDEGFVAAVKALDAAQTPEARIAAAALVLAPLKDPTSRVFVTPAVTPGPLVERTDAGLVTVHGARVPDGPDYWGPDTAQKLLGDAARVVVDLRGLSDESPVLGLSIFPSRAITLPAVQSMAHAGFDPRHTTIYRSRMEQSPGAAFRADPDAAKRRFALVLEPGDPVPDWALAQREAGLAIFVSASELSDEGALATTTVKLGDGATAKVRHAEYVDAHGLVATDVRVPRGKDALAVAADALRTGAQPKKVTRRAAAPTPLRPFELGPVDAKLPDREHRMLGGVRLWMIARRFWAYPSLRKVDADAQLFDLLARLEFATTLQDYRDTIAEAAMLLMPDSHVRVWSQELQAAQASPPFTAVWLEDQPVVSARTAMAGNVREWDVLEAIDGEKLSIRAAQRLMFTPGSRVDGRRLAALEDALHRAPGPHRVTVKHGSGRTETVEVVWDEAEAEKLFEPHAPGPHFKVLDGNIGFIDLVNLEPAEVDDAMAAVKDTAALIFDVRGYPKGTAFEIGPRLGPDKVVPGVAAMCTPLVRPGVSESDRTCEASLQQLPVWPGERYTNPVIALIDLQAISHSEHSCLILEAYTQVTFIGSPTRGANGNISHVVLPGEVGVSYTGLEVKHADGRQLQTTGIQPKITVRPTLAGLRAGRDEVLERALTFARTGH